MTAWRTRRRSGVITAAVAAVAAGLVLAIGASGASLPGSSFEIDDPAGATTGANLTVQGGAGALDWANVAETRTFDTPSGTSDNSYKGGGSKEDDVCPVAESTGGIPNNKSDLLAFGGYKEAGATPTSPGFLHVFWARVNNPNGTTNMDFEFNKSATPCGGGSPNVQRTAGDILLQFDVDNGGKNAVLSKRTWSGTQWGAAVPLSATVAIGSINQQPITAANSDGLSAQLPTPGSALSARTFGEASFDLASVFDPGRCQSFGSAMLKSRSSDSFTSALKDFILPIPLNIQNCASVIIHKQTVPDGDTQQFGFHETFTTDPAQAAPGDVFSLADGQTMTASNVLLGNGLKVSEDAVTAAGYSFVSIDCSASVGVTPSIVGQEVTFDLNASADVLECTFNNKKEEGAIKVTKASIKGSAPLAGAKFSVAGAGGPYALETNASGEACVDGLAFGAYTVTETEAPGGYAIDNPNAVNVAVDNNATCEDAVYGGELRAFTDTPLTDIDVSANSQDDGPGGTLTTITCKDDATPTPQHLPGSPTSNVHDPSLSVDDLEPGTYTCVLVIDP